MRTIIKQTEWDRYYYYQPQRWRQKKIFKENLEEETKKVHYCLRELVRLSILPHSNYNQQAFLEFRKQVHDNFFIYWTAINPPMEHLLFAISDILQPKNILGLGIFTGNPLVWSLGPVLQNHYPFQKLVGVEINKDHAQKCQKNFDKIRGTIPVTIYPEDAFHTIERYSEREIDLLYLDANGIDPTASARKGHPVSSKNINFSLLQKVYPKLKPGAVALCHNAYQPSFAKEAADYLRYTAQEDLFEKTVTVAIDEMGVEFSIKHI